MAEARILRAGSSAASGADAATVDLDGRAFGESFHGSLVHESVRAELNARRRGTAATRARSRISGGGAKPWRQKGTGRARAGSNRSALWVGGATLFGPQPRSYAFKVNRQERRAALRSALSLHRERDSVAVLEAGSFGSPSTRAAASLLADWGQPLPALVVLSESEQTAGLSFRNLARVVVVAESEVGVADLVGAASLLISRTALDALTARAVGRGGRRAQRDEAA